MRFLRGEKWTLARNLAAIILVCCAALVVTLNVGGHHSSSGSQSAATLPLPTPTGLSTVIPTSGTISAPPVTAGANVTPSAPVPTVLPNPQIPNTPNLRVPVGQPPLPLLNTGVPGFPQLTDNCTEAAPCTYVAHLTPAGNPVDQGSNINATITYTDNGSTITANGTGTGFAPTKWYLSLTYGTGAANSGPAACLVQPNESFDQMQVGDWQPIGSTTRTLTATRSGTAYFPFATADSTSVRRVDQVGVADSIPLMACGDLTRTK